MEIASARVYNGDRRLIQASSYQMPSSDSLRDMADLVRRGGQQLKRLYGECADEVSERISNFKDSALGRRLAAAKHRLDDSNSSDTIRRFRTYDELYATPARQVRFLRTAPSIQRHLNKDLLDGYKGRFVNAYADIPLEENPDYQKVYNGVGIETDEGIEFHTYTNNYDQEPEVELDVYQQHAIVENHLMMEHLLECDIDPTSPYGDIL